MGYGEFGGGGSVKWALDVDDAPAGGGKKRVNANGRDDQNPATFTVTIGYNDQAKANAAWTAIKSALSADTSNAKQIEFKIPFDDHINHKIKVNWP